MCVRVNALGRPPHLPSFAVLLALLCLCANVVYRPMALLLSCVIVNEWRALVYTESSPRHVATFAF